MLPSPIQLLNNQKNHFERMTKIITTNFAALDTSPMGTGKTYVTLKIAQTFNLPVLVVAPLNVTTMWVDVAKKYGVKVIESLSYRKLGGCERSGCNHDYLVRMSDTFYPSQLFTNLLQQKMLLVFDEVQNLKTAGTYQLAAAHCMVKEVIRVNSGSRVIALSADPCDKKEHIESLCKVLGIITYDELYIYNRSTKEYLLTGLKQLYGRCDTIDLTKAKEIYSDVRIRRGNVAEVTYELFVNVLKPSISSAMSVIQNNVVNQDIKNGYFAMTPEDLEEMKAGEALLCSTVHFNPITKTMTIPKGGFSDIVHALTQLESAKTRNLVPRLVREWFSAKVAIDNGGVITEVGCTKGIIFVWRTDTLDTLKANLKEYNPLIMDGSTKVEQRTEIVKKFQEPNSNHRLLICNAIVGCVGLSLDDQHGYYPRCTWIIPSYNFIQLAQAPGRTHRQLTKSNSIFRVVFSKDFLSERAIIDALAKKSEVVRNVIYDDKGVVLPDNYEDYVEGVGVVPRVDKLQII